MLPIYLPRVVKHSWNVFQNGDNTFSKLVNHFLSKSSKSRVVWTIRFCSNFTNVWSKYLISCMERLLASNVSISNGSTKCQIGKSFFAVNLPLKLFPAVLPLLLLTLEVQSFSIHSLKSVCTTCSSEIWTNSYGPNCTKFWAFDKNPFLF